MRHTTTSRREFLQAALAAGTAAALPAALQPRTLSAREPRSANEKLRLAVIGVADRGAANLAGVAHENIVALCDIDDQRLDEAAKRFPSAKKLSDMREVAGLADLDGVVVSTPDHTHAIPVAMALRNKLPVYCEKPLTHSVFEARTLRRLTAEAQVPTQMGNQIHAGANYRRVVEAIRSGAIGDVKRVHVWLGGGVRTGKRVTEGQPPAHVHYDLWLGPAPYRPFNDTSFHFNWRYWWDFGGGALADFGCHFMDLPFWALQLGAPTKVAAKGEKGHDGDNECPNRLQVDYEFPARGDMPPVELTWYHGGWMPAGAEDYKMGSAVLFEGTDGRLISDYGSHKVFLQSGKSAEPVKPWIKDSAGHHQVWLNAIRTGGPTASHFEYGGNLSEAVHLGNVAYRAGAPFIWDAAAMKCPDSPMAEQLLQRTYRDGWVL